MNESLHDISIRIQEDIDGLVDLSNLIIERNPEIVAAFFGHESPKDGFYCIRKLMKECMLEAPSVEEMWGRSRNTYLVHVGMIVFLVSKALNDPRLQLEPSKRMSLIYVLGWARGVLTFAHPDTNSLPEMKNVMHSLKMGEEKRVAHRDANAKRISLKTPFLDQIKKQVDAGYPLRGWKKLYNRTLNHAEFKELKDAIKPHIDDDGTEHRAFISERKLQSEVKELFGANRP